ncbi:MAG: hypothetical protein H0V17_29525 [Deltaproteobacteria bacterium]|nr:hypothetical protein [Deltaproteobacteria bacterium]
MIESSPVEYDDVATSSALDRRGDAAVEVLVVPEGQPSSQAPVEVVVPEGQPSSQAPEEAGRLHGS